MGASVLPVVGKQIKLKKTVIFFFKFQVMVYRRLLKMLKAVREMDKEEVKRKLNQRRPSIDEGNTPL